MSLLVNSWSILLCIFLSWYAFPIESKLLEGSLVMDSNHGWQAMVGIDSKRGKVTIHMSCISGVWFGLGFGSQSMNGTYAITVDGNGTVTERKLGTNSAGTDLSGIGALEVVRSSLIDDTSHRHLYRYIVVERNITMKDKSFYSFPTQNKSNIDVVYMRSNTSYFSTPLVKGSQKLLMTTMHCSVLRGYVALSTGETLLSSMPLFGPFQYPNINWTNVVVLSTNAEMNFCEKGFGTSVNQSIVLLPRGGNCTEHQKVLLAEAAGAVAVLIYDNEDTLIVEEIAEDDGNLQVPHIPFRMISESDGWDLRASQSRGGVMAQLQCFDGNYPSSLCFTDGGTDRWNLNGDFQLQAQSCQDCSPLWKRTGFPGMFRDSFLTLRTQRWELYYHESNRDYLQAYCNDTLTNPGECKKWYIKNETGFFYDPDATMLEDLCSVAPGQICVEAPNTHAGGLEGTYHQLATNGGFWTREMTLQDMTSAFLARAYWTDGSGDRRRQLEKMHIDKMTRATNSDWVWGFALVDSFQYEIFAYCQWGTIDEIGGEDVWNSLKYHPELCPEWYVLQDCDTYERNYDVDSSFSITTGECSFDSDHNHGRGTGEIDEHIPTQLCLSEAGPSFHIFFEGDYIMVPNMTTSSGRKVWFNQRLQNTDFPTYIWYYGDRSPSYRLWVIADALPNSTNVGVYGYCFADTDTPTECWGCWNFYGGSCFEAMCNIQTHGGSCATTTAPPDTVYPDSLCVTTWNTSLTTLTGSYSISTSYSMERPVWQHNENGNSWYVYYDSTLRLWKFGSSLTSAKYYCFEYVDWDPSLCVWTTENGYYGEINMTSSGSCPQYLDNASESTKQTGDGLAIGLSFGFILLITLFGLIYYFKAKGAFSSASASSSKPTTSQENVGEQHQVTSGATTTGNKRDSHSLELGRTEWETIDFEEHERQKRLQERVTQSSIPETGDEHGENNDIR